MKALETYFFEGVRPHSYPFLPFSKYLQLLLKWNAKINLTAITDPKKIIEEHFIDSLAAVNSLDGSTKILDVGSGGGLPGIPLAIAIPTASITLSESIKKKADFLKEVVRRLKLPNVTVENLRLDAKSNTGPFDAIVSRGTMDLNELIAVSIHLLSKNGQIISYKGPDLYNEIKEVKRGEIQTTIKSYKLPYSEKERYLAIFTRT